MKENRMKGSQKGERMTDTERRCRTKNKTKQKNIKHGPRSPLAWVGDVCSSNEAKPNILWHESPENFLRQRKDVLHTVTTSYHLNFNYV